MSTPPLSTPPDQYLSFIDLCLNWAEFVFSSVHTTCLRLSINIQYKFIFQIKVTYFFLSKTFQNLQNSNEIENRYGLHWKMLQSVNNDGSPKHDKCMASHARKIWALPTKIVMKSEMWYQNREYNSKYKSWIVNCVEKIET